MDVARLGNAVRASPSSRGSRLIRRSRKDEGCIGFAGRVQIDDEGQDLVLHFDFGRSLFGCLGSGGGDRGDRLSGIAHDRVFRTLERGIAQHGAAEERLDDMHALHAWMILGGGGVDGENFCMRRRGIHEFGIEHTRQLYVGGIAGAAGNLSLAVPALGRFADVVEVFVDRKHRRLRGRDGPRFLVQGIAGDANGHADSLGRDAGRVVSGRSQEESGIGCVVSVAMVVFSYALRVIWLAASSVAAKTLG